VLQHPQPSFAEEEMRYTKEILEPLVRSSFSIVEVIRKLGLRNINGGTHAHVTKRIKSFGLDMSHMLGKARNQGIQHKGGNDKLHWSAILIKDRFNGRKEGSDTLRRAMLESGIEEKCGSCGRGPEWNNKRLVLQISHKNGDSLNNEKTNLHFECPNCHSQTEDFAGRSAGKKSLRL
jgi:hypothetical protein